MDYKKLYEEALERARANYELKKTMGLLATADTIEAIFPELRESEDERIRKLILGKMEASRKYSNFWSDEEIAWVKKQKYNTEGDFGCGYDSGYQAGYAVAMNEMKPKVATATLDSEKQKEQKPCQTCDEYDKGYKQGYTEGCTAGYNKAMKEQKVLPGFDDWTPEENLPAGFYYIDKDGNKYYSKEFRYGDIKVKVGEQKPVDNSDFKIKLSEYLQNNSPIDGKYVISTESILEMAKEELIKRGELQNPAEWSDEDEKCLQEMIRHIEHCVQIYGASEPKWQQWLNLLNSLRPQPHWKPSEEQMNSLNYGIYVLEEEGYDASASEIKELYEQLKKLMEE